MPSPARILVVEDDPETRRYYAEALSRGGFETHQAHNGLQALQKAIDLQPALIVTDIVVPGIDGIELMRRLRADHRTSSIPVIAITGYDDRHYVDRALGAGAIHVLAKPCDSDALINEARQVLAASLR
jgi:CheY-like chemotaxis protein